MFTLAANAKHFYVVYKSWSLLIISQHLSTPPY